ncbi:hypothetical protein GCM10010464_54230 [Pseudonocardia yunnanensis]|uniref:Uncharacterized protein n=1 Tax=Pseudonocardia yunnanensis TaxID=58107 RepID=A0ABW4F7J6_9PSEU
MRGFHPEAMYEFKGAGDAVEELTDRVTFVDGDVVDHQRMWRISGAEAADPLTSGIVLAEGSTDSTVRGEDGPRRWAGKAGNPFWVEPDVLHAALACCPRPRGVRDLMATVSSRARSRARR